MKFYNSLSRKKEKFVPLKKNEVKMYVCGITPYDTTHLGHARTYFTFDILNRLLEYKTFKVKYIQNVTDVDKPLFKRSKRDGINWKILAEKYFNQFENDLNLLNIKPPMKFVKVSEEMGDIKEKISLLIERGNAFINANGEVYFRTETFQEFGKLSKYSYKKMYELAIQKMVGVKKTLNPNLLDFPLWELTNENPSWESPWGKGRPGWHIECSTIANKYLGDQIDIHGGGLDLIYPHHESEIAQSESLSEKRPFSNFWIHVAPLNYKGKKMSKSTGNLIFVKDILKKYSPQALRIYFANNHYRKSFEYDEQMLRGGEFLASFFKNVLEIPSKKGKEINFSSLEKKVISSLEDDLDTPCALEHLANLAKEIKSASHNKNISTAQNNFKKLTNLFGILF